MDESFVIYDLVTNKYTKPGKINLEKIKINTISIKTVNEIWLTKKYEVSWGIVFFYKKTKEIIEQTPLL